MRKRIFSLFIVIISLMTFSLPVMAGGQSNTVNPSHIYFSGGGTGYSDSHAIPTSLYVGSIVGGGSRYNRYRVTLSSFKFDNYPQNTNPGTSVRFNFRLVVRTSHVNAASVIYLYSVGTTDSNWVWDDFGYANLWYAMKANVSYYDSSPCGLTCSWYLYNP